MLKRLVKKILLSFCVFPGYKYCGPGCSGPGKPINDVDACCKAHDECLSNGRSQCECDQEFRKCLRTKVNLGNKKGVIAAVMYTYFKLQMIYTCKMHKKK